MEKARKDANQQEIFFPVFAIVVLCAANAFAALLGKLFGWKVKTVDMFEGLAACGLGTLMLISAAYAYYLLRYKFEQRRGDNVKKNHSFLQKG